MCQLCSELGSHFYLQDILYWPVVSDQPYVSVAWPYLLGLFFVASFQIIKIHILNNILNN